jgi:hypothetical protein
VRLVFHTHVRGFAVRFLGRTAKKLTNINRRKQVTDGGFAVRHVTRMAIIFMKIKKACRWPHATALPDTQMKK